MLRCFAIILGVSLSAPVVSQQLPTPLHLSDVVRIALEQRSEISAARARTLAAAQRPAIVSALPDPMISPSINHYPYRMMEDVQSRGRVDWSFGIEQSFPLSDVRSQRRRAAEAEVTRTQAEAYRVSLDIAFEVQLAFFMLRERREMMRVLEEQLALSHQLVTAASARYAGGKGMQSEVLRAEVEVARALAAIRALNAEIGAAQAMLNASMGRAASATVPEIEYEVSIQEPPLPQVVRETALRSRPELRAGASEVERSAAEIEVMRTMYRPMATVRLGPSSTMTAGPGAMIMVGITVPIWRERLRAGVAEAQAMTTMAQSDLEAMRRMIEGEATTSRENVNAARVRVESLRREIVPRTRMAVEAALTSYTSGRSTLVPLIEVSRALWDARSELVMAETILSTAWARLERASGGVAVPSQ